MLSGVTIVNKSDAQKALRKEEKKRSKREKKKSRKESKKERRDSSSDDSESGEPRGALRSTLNASPGAQNPQPSAQAQGSERGREDWMQSASFGEQKATSRDSKSSIQLKREEDAKRSAAVASERELNPFWKNGGDGKPPAGEGGGAGASNDTGKQSDPPRNAASTLLSAGASGGVGDGGASWRLKALKRAKERAAEEGRSLAEVVGDRWGSVGDLVQSIGSEAAHSKAHLKHNNSRSDGCFKCGGKGHFARDCPGGTGSVADTSGAHTTGGGNKRSRFEDEDEDIARARRRNDGMGKQSHASSRMQKPSGLNVHDRALLAGASREANAFKSDGSFMEQFHAGASGVGVDKVHEGENVGMGKHSRAPGLDGREIETAEYRSDTLRPVQPSRSDAGVAPSTGSVNMSAAAALRARLMGGNKKPPEEDTSDKHTSALPLVTEDGRAAPGAFGRATTLKGGVAAAEGAVRRAPKTTQRFDSSEKEKVRYYQDDDGVSLRDLVAAEKHGGEHGAYDTNYADNIMQDKRYKDLTTEKARDEAYDDEYDNDFGLEMYEKKDKKQSDQKRQEKQRQREIFEYERSEKNQKRCPMCLDNANKKFKHLHIAYGNNAYLMLPSHGRLVEGHCIIAPIPHIDSSRNCDEQAWEEIRNFKKCLVLMFAKQGKECCFIETVCVGSLGGGGGGLGARFAGASSSAVAGNPNLPHAFVECVPLPSSAAANAPMYFKKAIDESESEWAVHAGKRCLSTAPPKGLKQTIPTNFPYFHCEFNMKGGFVHVIDDVQKWRVDFGRDILCGLLELPPNKKGEKKRPLPPAVLKREMDRFLDQWDVVDWTKQL